MQDKPGKVGEFLEKDVWGTIKEVLNMGLHIGEGEKSIHITLGLLLLLITAFVVTSYVLKWLRHLLTRKMQGDDKMKFFSIFKFIKYFVYVAVILVTMSAAGIDITILLTASAALFVGLGLALQELFQDVIAGIFIITDKSLLVGDIIEVDGKVVRVFEIKLRTTRAITRDDKVIIIPNHIFLSGTIFSHTQNRDTTRETVNVGVAYGSDVEKVTQILLDCAREHSGVLKSPEPFVLFEDFGDSALLFALKFHVVDSFTTPNVKSELRYKIDKAFRENQVTIPFPQRDVHIYQNDAFQVRQKITQEGKASE
ncbi:mechanosensitive ion channel family protein [Lentiprolixibacter aurantiacus]|uniref:mechanosensitive ion channel family protein n=1 Tax=Lentiprolixibacter aurantiacus TaxID=2993939 RepID=UPI003F70B444